MNRFDVDEKCPICGGLFPTEAEFKTKEQFNRQYETCKRLARCVPCVDKLIDEAYGVEVIGG